MRERLSGRGFGDASTSVSSRARQLCRLAECAVGDAKVVGAPAQGGRTS
jgi:hypothetical protein